MVDLIGIATLATAGATAAVSWLVIRLGPRLGFVDDPDGSTLKVHDAPAVPMGGVAVWSGLVVGAMLDPTFDARLVGAATALLALGLTDDRLSLSPAVRMTVEVGVAAIYSAAVADGRGAWWALAATVLILVAVNAVNLYDGLDGLAGGTGLVTALGLALVSISAASPDRWSARLVVALAVFLAFNWHPARMFLGDNGSYLLGFLLAALAVQPSSGEVSDFLARSAILGVFLVDLTSTVLRRRLAGRPLFTGDRSHTYDRLVDRGMPVPKVALLSMTVQTIWVGVWLTLSPDRVSTALILLTAGAVATVAVAVSARPQAI